MSTRGLIGIRKNKIDKCIYNHYDSYPSCLGEIIVKYIKKHTNYAIELLYDRLKAIDYNFEYKDLSEEEKNNFHRYLRSYNIEIKNESVYVVDLIRNFEGNFEMYDMFPEINFYEEYKNFIKDSLFCEWAYIINLDTKKLEIYTGFQKKPDKNNRYGTEKNNSGYYPCKLIKQISLTTIRKDDFNLEETIKEIFY